MSGRISADKIQQMRQGVDLVALVSRYVSLKRSGRNHFGLCPFHSEKSPSFSVSASGGFFKCFGCGAGGDAYEFLMRIEGLSFFEAAERLAGELGIDLELEPLTREQQQQQQEHDRLQRVAALTAEFYHQTLMQAPEAEPCRLYLRQRGYGRRMAADCLLGYAPDTWDALIQFLRREQIALDDARALGLIRQRKNQTGDYDLFRGRLIFPIRDLAGKVVAFGGRILGAGETGQPKYINSPQSQLYHKGALLFGLDRARQEIRKQDQVILVEGYFDQLALIRAGFGQAVATCGTSLTQEHAALLKRYTRRMLLLFDSDQAGRKAAYRAMEQLLPQGWEALLVELNAGEDPDSFLRRWGRDAFRQQVERARPVVEIYIQDCLERAGTGSSARARAIGDVLQTLLLIADPVEQQLYLRELSERSGLEASLLQQQLLERKAQQPGPLRASAAPVSEEVPVTTLIRPSRSNQPQSIPPAELRLIQLLIYRPELREEVAEQGVDCYFIHARARQLAEKILARLDTLQEGEALRAVGRLVVAGEAPQELLQCDPAGFAELGRTTLESYRSKVADQQRRQELKRQIEGVHDDSPGN